MYLFQVVFKLPMIKPLEMDIKCARKQCFFSCRSFRLKLFVPLERCGLHAIFYHHAEFVFFHCFRVFWFEIHIYKSLYQISFLRGIFIECKNIKSFCTIPQDKPVFCLIISKKNTILPISELTKNFAYVWKFPKVWLR